MAQDQDTTAQESQPRSGANRPPRQRQRRGGRGGRGAASAGRDHGPAQPDHQHEATSLLGSTQAQESRPSENQRSSTALRGRRSSRRGRGGGTSTVAQSPAVVVDEPASIQEPQQARFSAEGILPHHYSRGGRRGRRGGGPQVPSVNSDQEHTGSESHPATLNESLPEAVPTGPRRHRNNDQRRGRVGRGASSNIGPGRRFERDLSSLQNSPELSSRSMLNGNAPEFVPVQVVAAQPSPSGERVSHRLSLHGRLQLPTNSLTPDLITRIHEDIDQEQYECVICTSEVRRTSHIWSCPICWTVTHRKCALKWHRNQIDGETQTRPRNQPGEWRCPGCNSYLPDGPGPHTCWCSKEINPKSIIGLPPNSCGQSCAKPRSTCPHPCPLMCHAGPCPPCTLMGPSQSCFCSKRKTTKKCVETQYTQGWSCQEPCGRLLPCGDHHCTRPCHSGACGSCDHPVLSRCYCGREQKQIACGLRQETRASFNPVEGQWSFGTYECGGFCQRKFDCGHHSCLRPCHPQDETAAHCLLSPDVITHCPCGKTHLKDVLEQPRSSCQDAIPHCSQDCEKLLACGHRCLEICHAGPCKPCRQTVEISCRCDRVSAKSLCHQGSVMHPMCFRICRAQLNCGRHECGERCCTGERKAAERRRNRRTAPNDEVESEHICMQVCGRPLKCGNHTCQALCHRGPCLGCPEAIFDEISCSCGRTVLQPPLACGTRPPECRYDCLKPQPCGHPPVAHQCHTDDVPCPKCPFLVEKRCICGKKKLRNQPCWLKEARCGLPCGKTLKCGTHECQALCHASGRCEDQGIDSAHCSQRCGKARKSCGHDCTDECHNPFPCKEDSPCQAKTFITCHCQHRKQEVRCMATRLRPGLDRGMLKCEDECLRLQRNARLAAALNIDPEWHVDDHIPYSTNTLKAFKDNPTWAQTQEREFRVFAADPKEKTLRFKPMPPPRRAFLHLLAQDFGLDSESQDGGPHRHVCIFKTPRFVSAPKKTLAQCVRYPRVDTAPAATAAHSPQFRGPIRQEEAFNAFLLQNPKFALTIDDIERDLLVDLTCTASQLDGPAIKFETTFLTATDAVLLKAHAHLTAATMASVLAPTPQAIEDALVRLKPTVERVLVQTKLASSVTLCHVDSSLQINRRQDIRPSKDAEGWSAVARRRAKAEFAAAGAAGAGASAWGVGTRGNTGGASERRAPSLFVALKKTTKTPAAPPTAVTGSSVSAGTTPATDASNAAVEEDIVALVWPSQIDDAVNNASGDGNS